MLFHRFSKRHVSFLLFITNVFICLTTFKQAKASITTKKSFTKRKHGLFELKQGKKSFTLQVGYLFFFQTSRFSAPNQQLNKSQLKTHEAFDLSPQSSSRNDIQVSGEFSYFVTKYLALVGSLSFKRDDLFDTQTKKDGKLILPNNIITPDFSGGLGIGLRYFFSVSKYFLPYIGGGVDYWFRHTPQKKFEFMGEDQQGNSKTISLDFEETSHRLSFGISLGALIPITKNIALDIGSRATLQGIWAHAGVSYFF